MSAIFKEIYDTSAHFQGYPLGGIVLVWNHILSLRDPVQEQNRLAFLQIMIAENHTQELDWCTMLSTEDNTVINCRKFSDVASANRWKDWHDQNFSNEGLPVVRSVQDNTDLPYQERFVVLT